MFETKNYFKKELINPIAIICIIIIGLYTLLGAFMLLTIHIAHISFTSKIFLIDNEYITIFYPQRFFKRSYNISFDSLEKVIYQKHSKAIFGSLPFIKLNIKHNETIMTKKFILYSLMSMDERTNLENQLRNKVKDKLIII